ncbi:MAG: HD family phosphohydrolase [Muribaculaceae bacterium]
MAIFNIKIKRTTMLQSLLFVATIAIVALCLPHDDKFHYSYQVDKPWEYSLLTAPFDIPIELDTATATARRDSVMRTFINVYKVNKAVSASQMKLLVQNLQSKNASSSERLFYVRLLDEVYNRGIVDNATYERIQAGTLPYVRHEAEDHTIENLSTAHFLSVRTAYEYIDSVVSSQNMRERFNSYRINSFLEPNMMVDSVRSSEMLKARLQKELAPVGIIQKGERIIDRGNVVTPQVVSALNYMKSEYEASLAENRENSMNMLSRIVVIIILFAMLYIYLLTFHPNIFFNMRNLTFVMSLLTCFTSIFFIAVSIDPVKSSYVMPFALVPIVMATFFNTNSAIVVHSVEVMLASIVSTYSTDLVLMQFVVGVIAVASIQEMTRRSQLARTAVMVFVCYSIIYIAFFVMEKGSFNGISRYVFFYFIINAILLSFSNLLIYMLEKIFGFTSSLTLVELTDLNQPLLRQLSDSCPGTFQHAMQVANISAEAAHRIGANVQLVRVGAIYHDIGKINSPNFFTENQSGVNPHTPLTPEQSAKIVIRHVTDGMELAEKYKLPQAIREFIQQHHGNGMARYFYTQACNQHPDEEIDPAPFTYPGPNPQTREVAIVMMADATEAASKSLTDRSQEAITQLVNKIIDGQIASGLLAEAPISFRDVAIIKEIFIKRLCTFYHMRVKYPDMVKRPQTPAADEPQQQQ